MCEFKNRLIVSGKIVHFFVPTFAKRSQETQNPKRTQENAKIVVLKPDKGNGIVVQDRKIYDEGSMKIISDTSKFSRLDNDPTLLRKCRLQRVSRSLKKKNEIDNEVYEKIYPSGSQPAKNYGLPKMYKEGSPNAPPPFRPIVSSIGTFNYGLAKYLCTLLRPPLPSDYCAKDTSSFVNKIREVSTTGKFMVSFDESLFTNIYLAESIELAVHYISEYSTKISQANLKKLFNFATAQTYFLFNRVYFD